MLKGLDLNLLLAFDALMVECEQAGGGPVRGVVTRAAATLGVSQPAMSAALGRLRRSFGDPLLVRSMGGMVPTPRALTLAVPVRAALRTLEQALGPRTAFQPSEARRRFTLACTDYTQLLLIPGLAAQLAAQAPGVDLRVVASFGTGDLREELESGRVDLALGFFPRLPTGLKHAQLLSDKLVCLTRREHPALAGTPTLERYLGMRHLMVTPRGNSPGMVDHALARLGHKRRVALRVPSLATAPFVLTSTDMVLTVATQLAHQLVKALPLHITPAPLELPPLAVGMAWHPRQEQAPEQRWLRGLLLQLTGHKPAPHASGCTSTGDNNDSET